MCFIAFLFQFQFHVRLELELEPVGDTSILTMVLRLSTGCYWSFMVHQKSYRSCSFATCSYYGITLLFLITTRSHQSCVFHYDPHAYETYDPHSYETYVGRFTLVFSRQVKATLFYGLRESS